MGVCIIVLLHCRTCALLIIPVYVGCMGRLSLLYGVVFMNCLCCIHSSLTYCASDLTVHVFASLCFVRLLQVLGTFA